MLVQQRSSSIEGGEEKRCRRSMRQLPLPLDIRRLILCNVIKFGYWICNNNPVGAITVDDEQHKLNIHPSLGILGGLTYELEGKEGKNAFNR